MTKEEIERKGIEGTADHQAASIDWWYWMGWKHATRDVHKDYLSGGSLPDEPELSMYKMGVADCIGELDE